MPVVVQRHLLVWFSAELESLFVRQSTAASGRISRISCSRGSHMEIWRIVSSGFVPGSLVFGVSVSPAEYQKLDLPGDDFSYMLGSKVNACSASVRSVDALGALKSGMHELHVAGTVHDEESHR